MVRYHPVDLERAFFSSRFTRKLDTLGYARFRHWRLYAEEGLARQPVAVWLGNDGLSVKYGGQVLSSYDVSLSEDAKLREVTNPDFSSPSIGHAAPDLRAGRARRVRLAQSPRTR